MLKNDFQAGTAAPQSTAADVTTSSPTFAKPHVVRSYQSSPNLEFDIDKKSNEILKGFSGLSLTQSFSVIKLLIILIKQNCQVLLPEDVLASQESRTDN